MQNNKKLDIALKKLKELFTIIECEAKKSPAFLEKLATVFNQDSESITNPQPSEKKIREPFLNIVDILHRLGKDRLNEELDLLTNDQLAKLASQEGIKKYKDSKTADRKELIDSLVEIASNRLSQGSSFIKQRDSL